MNSEFVFNQQNIGVGRRKQATARVFLTAGNGTLTINQTSGDRYLQYNETYLKTIWAPFQALELDQAWNIVAIVRGGGLTSQTTAIQLAVARQLLKINPENRSKLKSLKFLTCDSRMKERKKYGLKKARKASQYSKR